MCTKMFFTLRNEKRIYKWHFYTPYFAIKAAGSELQTVLRNNKKFIGNKKL